MQPIWHPVSLRFNYGGKTTTDTSGELIFSLSAVPEASGTLNKRGVGDLIQISVTMCLRGPSLGCDIRTLIGVYDRCHNGVIRFFGM